MTNIKGDRGIPPHVLSPQDPDDHCCSWESVCHAMRCEPGYDAVEVIPSV